MSLDQETLQEDHATRTVLPPVESDTAAALGSQAYSQSPQILPQQAKGNWFHRNRWFTKEPLTFFGYQFLRSSLATIPYGFGMAFFHHMFGLMSVYGQRMGLSERGQKEFTQLFTTRDPVTYMTGSIGKAIEVVDKFTEAERAVYHKPGLKGVIGRSMIRVGNSPLNAALQIGLAFSMFRFTGGLVKGLRDKVMDEKNTAEDTTRETNHWWGSIKEMMRINWKAEAVGTFWAALTLGFIGGLFKQTEPYLRKPLPGGGVEKFTTAIARVWGRSSKLLQNGFLWMISYATFFEVDERIQKDVKLREGTWKGHPNSLTNKPGDITVAGPVLKDEKGKTLPAEEQPAKPKGAFFTDDPGIPRLVFRRLLPVLAGITGYAVMKRVGYVVGGGQMQAITDDVVKMGFAGNLKHFGKNAWREGLATATFGVVWAATDAWGSWYDKFFEKMQDPAKHTPATPHQQQKYSELLDRVNAKEAGAHRVA